MKNWPEPKSNCDIQVFLDFANLYHRFIQGISRIAAPLTSMLKMSPTSTMQKSKNLIHEFGGGDRSENEARRAFTLTKGPTKADYLSHKHVNLGVSNIVSHSAKNVSNYLILDANRAFNQLRQAFTETPILKHFDPEQYMQIETDPSWPAIGEALS